MAKEEIILEVKVDQGDAFAELEKTKKAIIGLKEEQSELNKAYKAGNISVEEYAQESVRVEQVLKKQTKTYSDLTHQVQGTKSMTDQLKGSFAQLAPGVNSSIEGFKGMASAAKSFIMTPIGAVIAAIGVAVTAVVAYLKQFESVLDVIENITTKVTAGFSAFIQNLDKVANIIGNVLIGNFSVAAKEANNLGKAIGSAANEAQRLLDKTRDLEDAQMKFDVATASVNNQIKAYIIASKNKNLTLEESNALLQKAIDLEKEQTDQAVRLAQEKADIEEGLLVQSKKAQLEKANLLRQESESQEEYINRLIDSGIFSPEQLEPLISAFKKVQEESSNTLAFREKVQNIEDANAEKELSRIEKLNAAKQKALEDEMERYRLLDEFLAERAEMQAEQDEKDLEKWAEQFTKKNEAEAGFKQNLADETVVIQEDEAERVNEIQSNASEAQKRRAKETLALVNEFQKQGMSLKQAELRAHQLVEQQKLSQTSEALGAAASLLKKNTIAYKVVASAQATINAYQAASNALKDYQYPLNLVMAALAGAAGIAQVAKINDVDIAAAGGAKFTTKGPTLLLVGDNPGGRERVEVTPLSGKGQTKVYNGGRSIAMAGGGSIDGSILAAASTQSLDAQFALQGANNNMPPVYVSWTEKTEFEEKMAFKAQLTEK